MMTEFAKGRVPGPGKEERVGTLLPVSPAENTTRNLDRATAPAMGRLWKGSRSRRIRKEGWSSSHYDVGRLKYDQRLLT